MASLSVLWVILAASLFAVLSLAAEIDPIVIKGSYFFHKSSGERFFMKGVAYQASPDAGDPNYSDVYTDPLADVTACRRDVPLLKELGTNVIRVYAIKPSKDHSVCMKLLADAGIYVIADLSQPSQSINRDEPSWDIELYNRYVSVVDSLARYTNVIGFFAGNEVANNKTNTNASAFVKAAVRDMKAYIVKKNYRPMGIGYAADDNADIRDNLAAYFDCGTDAERIDFWGYNIYEWCGESSFERSGYAERTKEFADYNVPVFFAEYGCNEVQPRKFSEVQAIYGPKMTPVWSGGIVYMYFQEENDYGLVELNGSEVEKRKDFTSLANQIAKAKPKGIKMADYTPTNNENAPCPTVDASWEAASILPPTPNKSACSCMVDSLGCVGSKDLTEKQLGPLFSVVCGLSSKACQDIEADAASGTYGPYGMCEPRDKLSLAFNNYYKEQVKKGRGSGACDFRGAAKTVKTIEPTGVCTSVITGEPGATSQGAAASVIGFGDSTLRGMLPFSVQACAYILCAVIAGMATILL